MLFHCMTGHGFASADVMRSGETIDVKVECVGLVIPVIRFAICFQAPKAKLLNGKTPEKLFALLALSQFNFTRNPAPCTATRLTFDDLVLDESLILSEAV